MPRDPLQLALIGDDGAAPDPYYASVWHRLLALLNESVHVVGMKRAAADLDTSPSKLSHALAERDRHYMRAEWLPYLIAHAPSDAIVELLASIRSLDVVPRRVMTADEKLARLEQVLGSQLGKELHEAIRRRAWGDR